mmetsp:Transcript_42780/g.84383  ORF Transcript_42780/g.84383 Transcript_42780/m.84383 type:complete len:105 (-) Transcript_42780:477-791(-)
MGREAQEKKRNRAISMLEGFLPAQRRTKIRWQPYFRIVEAVCPQPPFVSAVQTVPAPLRWISLSTRGRGEEKNCDSESTGQWSLGYLNSRRSPPPFTHLLLEAG